MATTDQYFDMAMRAHNNQPTGSLQQQANLRARNQNLGGAPYRWTQQRGHAHKPFFAWKPGTGFQAAYFTNNQGSEHVLAIAATQGWNFTDILADSKLALSVMPRQASSAERFFKAVIPPQTNPADVVVVGHSLGGALAQALGFWHGVRFVTFNAPGMMRILAGSMMNVAKPQQLGRTWKWAAKSVFGNTERGINIIVSWDLIGNFGAHVGTAKRIPATAGTGLKRHGPDAVQDAIFDYKIGGRRLADLDPFQVL
jgi:hypothetical protein